MKIRDNINEEPADERYKALLIIQKSAQLSNVLYELKTVFWSATGWYWRFIGVYSFLKS